jgi:hypothetical protein
MNVITEQTTWFRVTRYGQPPQVDFVQQQQQANPGLPVSNGLIIILDTGPKMKVSQFD